MDVEEILIKQFVFSGEEVLEEMTMKHNALRGVMPGVVHQHFGECTASLKM